MTRKCAQSICFTHTHSLQANSQKRQWRYLANTMYNEFHTFSFPFSFLSFFSFFLFFSYIFHLVHTHSFIHSRSVQADPLSVIGVFPGLLPPHGVGREAFPPLELAGPQRDRAIKALSDFLRKDRGTLRTEGDAVRSARREALEEAEKTILETVKDGKYNITKTQETLQQLSTLGISVSGLNFGEGEESQVRDVFELLKDRADGLLDEQQRLPYAECTDPLVILDTTLLKVCTYLHSDLFFSYHFFFLFSYHFLFLKHQTLFIVI